MQQYINCNKKETTLPRKYRELIIMALGCAKGTQTTINTHGRLARENGATIEEIGEVLRLVFFLCGATALIPAAEIFESLDTDWQHQTEPETRRRHRPVSGSASSHWPDTYSSSCSSPSRASEALSRE